MLFTFSNLNQFCFWLRFKWQVPVPQTPEPKYPVFSFQPHLLSFFMFIAAICVRYLDLYQSVWHSRVVKQCAYGYCICIWINVSFITHILWNSCFGCSANNCRIDLSSSSPFFSIFFFWKYVFDCSCPLETSSYPTRFSSHCLVTFHIQSILCPLSIEAIYIWIDLLQFIWNGLIL